MKKVLLLIPILIAVGCANLSDTAWKLAKTAGDTGRSAVHAWNAYYPLATNGASPATITKLTSEQNQIYDASRKLGATLIVVTNLAEAYAANSAQTNKAALQAGLEALNSQSKSIAQLIQMFMGQ